MITINYVLSLLKLFRAGPLSFYDFGRDELLPSESTRENDFKQATQGDAERKENTQSPGRQTARQTPGLI